MCNSILGLIEHLEQRDCSVKAAVNISAGFFELHEETAGDVYYSAEEIARLLDVISRCKDSLNEIV